jgi:hypothetical protein
MACRRQRQVTARIAAPSSSVTANILENGTHPAAGNARGAVARGEASPYVHCAARCGHMTPVARGFERGAAVGFPTHRTAGATLPPFLSACLCHSQSSDGNTLARSRVFRQITSQRLPSWFLDRELPSFSCRGSVHSCPVPGGVRCASVTSSGPVFQTYTTECFTTRTASHWCSTSNCDSRSSGPTTRHHEGWSQPLLNGAQL